MPTEVASHIVCAGRLILHRWHTTCVLQAPGWMRSGQVRSGLGGVGTKSSRCTGRRSQRTCADVSLFQVHGQRAQKRTCLLYTNRVTDDVRMCQARMSCLGAFGLPFVWNGSFLDAAIVFESHWKNVWVTLPPTLIAGEEVGTYGKPHIRSHSPKC